MVRDQRWVQTFQLSRIWRETHAFQLSLTHANHNLTQFWLWIAERENWFPRLAICQKSSRLRFFALKQKVMYQFSTCKHQNMYFSACQIHFYRWFCCKIDYFWCNQALKVQCQITGFRKSPILRDSVQIFFNFLISLQIL